MVMWSYGPGLIQAKERSSTCRHRLGNATFFGDVSASRHPKSLPRITQTSPPPHCIQTTKVPSRHLKKLFYSGCARAQGSKNALKLLDATQRLVDATHRLLDAAHTFGGNSLFQGAKQLRDPQNPRSTNMVTMAFWVCSSLARAVVGWTPNFREILAHRIAS